MKLSTKGRHAVTAMMELALQHNKGPVTLADISAQQSISISYLEQVCVVPVVAIAWPDRQLK